MALEAPLRSSTESILSSHMPPADMSVPSPSSPAVRSQYMAMSAAPSPDPQSLRPPSSLRSHSAHLMSPSSDIVGPSPVTSNGTETTEIEDDFHDDTTQQEDTRSGHPQLMMLRTNIPDHIRRSVNEEVVSVIHAPESFQTWRSSNSQTGTSTTASIDNTVTGSMSPPQSEYTSAGKSSPREPPPIATDVLPAADSAEAPTPQAQNLRDVLGDISRIRSGSTSSLELIPENKEAEADGEGEPEEEEDLGTPEPLDQGDAIKALRMALEECWTLCNTLAGLSSIHRERVFNSSGTPDAHEKAWKSCWKLCKKLYHSQDDSSESFNVRTNLDLCRDFCQALFDVRQRQDDISDSVLRVSFELNNHLYSAQDNRNLPEAFRERTLDFYITLCHRLMKQRSELAEETDSLLRYCWNLAEMLFNLRQNRRDGKAPDEELLGSAVQACWDLCDIFREGWTKVRPDRSTPRPTQMAFSPSGFPASSDAPSTAGSRASYTSKRDSVRSASEADRARKKVPFVPETPVTEFEDTPISPESSSPQMPNILVLGTSTADGRSKQGGRWSSSASNLSSYSHNSGKTSSTATTAAAAGEDANVARVKVLLLKAAMNVGFSRDSPTTDGPGGTTALQNFVKNLPTGSFGSLPSHATLLQSYKSLVLADATFRGSAMLPSRGKRVHAGDMAKSVLWMAHRSSQYGFLRDLFKLVYGFLPEDVESKKNVSIAV
ncbi:hypothetical protein VTK73DRAFT_6975 [Phialemonium thermophilum]|uniref:DUF7624 domain-containing protein n=1 Tax=Phialemonium thermophilum TaxID=223376 RepID=A0ABR3WHB5_9PEZI